MAPAPLDEFLPAYDARERSHTVIRASADRVYDIALTLDFQSIGPLRWVFWLRSRLMRAAESSWRRRGGFVEEMIALGWERLAERPGELFIGGAACQPWLADVRFEPLGAERFRDASPPDRVKIAWTLEVRRLADGRSELATETRVSATDAAARRRFRSYWRWARFGIILIRWLVLGEVRRRAERETRARSG